MDNAKHIHMIAVCGMGMGAFAGLLQEAGHRVTGSDQNVYPPMSVQLADAGIKVMSPYSPENLKDRPDLVIIGNAVRKTNPESSAAIEAGIPYMSFPEALDRFFLSERRSLVVAGTHGKTTTCSMAAWMLEKCGKNPGFLIGGILNNFGKCCKAGKKDGFFVTEGDEYDTAFFDKGPKFMHYRPSSAIITSVEFDHGDIYRDIEHIKSAFSAFIRLIPEGGTLVACSDFIHLREILPEASCRVETYGFNEDASWTAADISLGQKSSFTIMHNGTAVAKAELQVPGKHNVINAVGAVALLASQGIDPQEAASALASFEGVRRRQEIRGTENGVSVIDDFAHHPTKVRATVSAIKSRYPDRTVWAVFEPRTNSSRRAFFQNDYVSSFDDADRIVIADVFNKEQIADSDRFSSEKLVDDLNKRGLSAEFMPSADAIISHVADNAADGDVVLVMSNGGFENLHARLLEALKAKSDKN
ncbi:MAG: UDP-N-acetylmuramate:L-alanyl-gamma-D-glutamyl-meso-diaminopimelate ligase [bacterium]|nr:UDP-N-acetylmuramate:L-alanyl-gamma-D-glutamyl-meso-diaminopimelate ligase [bacterium]